VVTERVPWVDFNGVHALSGFLLVFHLATGALFAIVATIQLAQDRA